jgi:response regulator of citrate/malate metabolism
VRWLITMAKKATTIAQLMRAGRQDLLARDLRREKLEEQVDRLLAKVRHLEQCLATERATIQAMVRARRITRVVGAEQ